MFFGLYFIKGFIMAILDNQKSNNSLKLTDYPYKVLRHY